MFAAKTRPMREWNIAKSNKPIQISHPQSSHQNNWAVTDIPIEPRTREILLTLGNGFSPWIMMDYDNPQLLLYCLYNHRLINSATFSMAKCRFVVVVTPTQPAFFFQLIFTNPLVLGAASKSKSPALMLPTVKWCALFFYRKWSFLHLNG